MISILLHLIETPYFLILELVGRRDHHFSVTLGFWIGVHILRLMTIVQPCFAASNEVISDSKMKPDSLLVFIFNSDLISGEENKV